MGVIEGAMMASQLAAEAIATRAKYLCDFCAADLVNAKLIRPHGDIFGSETRWQKKSCCVCNRIEDCVSRTDVPRELIAAWIARPVSLSDLTQHIKAKVCTPEQYRRALFVSLRNRNLTELSESLRKPIAWLEGILDGTGTFE